MKFLLRQYRLVLIHFGGLQQLEYGYFYYMNYFICVHVIALGFEVGILFRLVYLRDELDHLRNVPLSQILRDTVCF